MLSLYWAESAPSHHHHHHLLLLPLLQDLSKIGRPIDANTSESGRIEESKGILPETNSHNTTFLQILKMDPAQVLVFQYHRATLPQSPFLSNDAHEPLHRKKQVVLTVMSG